MIHANPWSSGEFRLKPAIEKLVAFADAGADCLYAPGARDRHDIAERVKAVAPKPINIV
ncbi:MAG: isocitrate lyase/phosphoenolpyruvate mutase family protein, partial [Methylocella sp.]